MTYVPRCNRAHLYFQRANLLFASGVPSGWTLAEHVCPWWVFYGPLLFCFADRFVQSHVSVAEGADCSVCRVNGMQKDKLFKTNIAAWTAWILSQGSGKERKLRIESVEKKLIKAYFMRLQDMHFITIAPFKILSVPKIAKTLPYLTDSNLNKTTEKTKLKDSALRRLCPIIIHYIPNGR